ncbi:hypothetical protein ABE28_013180 [Peribacillus muralis]|uniref:Uncharacterized protein n=1 Tax=Peribacillus muralis TaxID=264697 RepID=A0A1B3XQ18_9BACI|nr:hypothetical protein ABE28_013180 [Peribacillus muralis]
MLVLIRSHLFLGIRIFNATEDRRDAGTGGSPLSIQLRALEKHTEGKLLFLITNIFRLASKLIKWKQIVTYLS